MTMTEKPNRKIKSIHLKNFQNHKDSLINLTDGLNLVVGSSDSGKTAIARALHYVLNDAYSGNHFVCHGEKFYDVTIEFVDGSIIRRTKGNGLNRVEYKYPDDLNFTIRAAFGDKYPEDIVEFLSNPPYIDELGYLSYSDQSNKNFLLDLTPSQLPKAISTIVGVDDLERASAELTSSVTESSKSIKLTESQISEINIKINNNFVTLDDDLNNLNKVKNLISESSEIIKTISMMKNIYSDFNRINTSGNKAKKELNQSIKIISLLKDDIDKISDLQSNIKSYEKVYEKHHLLETKINKTSKEVDSINKILNGEYKQILEDIESLNSDFSSLKSMNESLIQNEVKLTNAQTTLNQIVEDLKLNQKNYNLLKKEIKDKGLYCDSCNKFGGEIL